MAHSSVIGLDIGSSQIKAVHLERQRDRWRLESAGIVPTPPESVQDGVVLDVPKVTEAIRQLFREYRLPPTETVAAVSGSHVMVRAIKVPDMNAASLRRSIRFEAAKHIDQGSGSATIENCAVEFEVKGKSGQPPQLDVMIVVAPWPMVNGRVNVMEGAGLDPVAVDVEAFALSRTLHAAGLVNSEEEAVVVLNIGATYTDLDIMLDGEIAVTRSIPIGGNALTQSLASVWNVDGEEAEQRKRQVDVSAREVAANGGGPDPAARVAGPYVDEIIRELRRSIIYFQSQAAEAGKNVPVEHLVLAGGGTLLPGLGAYLRERLGIHVASLDPLEIDQANGAAAERWAGRGPEFAVAMGLALKEYD